MQSSDEFVYDADGNPFHLADTRIFREADGSLSYECSHCGRHGVPRRLWKDLAQYASDARVATKPEGMEP
jgi:hypothetical protein